MIRLPLILWTAWTFAVGAAVGSLLNVVAARLPLQKSLLWPGSYCPACFRPVRWFDNIPLLSYWILRGRCRSCRAVFSVQYFIVELFTAVAFAGLFWLVLVENVYQFPYLDSRAWSIRSGLIPAAAWVVYFHHAVLMAFLIGASLCDLRTREIPLSLTLTGASLGLLASPFLAWPWPNHPADAGVVPPGTKPWWQAIEGVGPGQYPWPVWGPLPEWLPPGSWQLGLATGVAGALFGTMMLRAVRFLFSRGMGREALGLGDADLMLMAGAFCGWQVVFVAFFVGAIVSLGFAVVRVIVIGDTELPFGPGLAAGVMLTLLFWWKIGPVVQVLLFNEMLMLTLGGAAAVFMLMSGLVIRLFRRPDAGEPS